MLPARKPNFVDVALTA